MNVRKGVKKHDMHINPKSSELKLSEKHSIFEDKKSLLNQSGYHTSKVLWPLDNHSI